MFASDQCLGPSDLRTRLARKVGDLAWKDAPLSRIVAVGLLTQADLDVLGAGFTRLFPADPAPCFNDLLAAIDRSDRELQVATGNPSDNGDRGDGFVRPE